MESREVHPAIDVLQTDPILNDTLHATPWIADCMVRLYDHHPETFHHSVDVARTLAIFSNHSEPEYVVRLGLLHDYGKTEVSKTTLNTTETLLPHQIVELRSHPRMTFELTSPLDHRLAVDAVAHHERQINPYPRRIDRGHTDTQIELMIVDKITALLMKRSYRAQPFTEERIMVELGDYFESTDIVRAIDVWRQLNE